MMCVIIVIAVTMLLARLPEYLLSDGLLNYVISWTMIPTLPVVSRVFLG